MKNKRPMTPYELLAIVFLILASIAINLRKDNQADILDAAGTNVYSGESLETNEKFMYIKNAAGELVQAPYPDSVTMINSPELLEGHKKSQSQ